MTNASTKNGSNGAHPDAAITPEHDLLWDSLCPKVVTELEKPLDPSLVSQRKGRAGRPASTPPRAVPLEQSSSSTGLRPSTSSLTGGSVPAATPSPRRWD